MGDTINGGHTLAPRTPAESMSYYSRIQDDINKQENLYFNSRMGFLISMGGFTVLLGFTYVTVLVLNTLTNFAVIFACIAVGILVLENRTFTYPIGKLEALRTFICLIGATCVVALSAFSPFAWLQYAAYAFGVLAWLVALAFYKHAVSLMRKDNTAKKSPDFYY